MDNDCKVIAKEALPLLVDVLEKHPLCACTGAYAVKVLDWQKMIALTGTVFNASHGSGRNSALLSASQNRSISKSGRLPDEGMVLRKRAIRSQGRKARLPRGSLHQQTLSRYRFPDVLSIRNEDAYPLDITFGTGPHLRGSWQVPDGEDGA